MPATVVYNSSQYSVTRIADMAFINCHNLQSAVIPSTITQIGSAVFRFCPMLTSIEVSPENPAYHSTDGVLFTKGETTLIAYPPAKQADSYSLPDATTEIE